MLEQAKNVFPDHEVHLIVGGALGFSSRPQFVS